MLQTYEGFTIVENANSLFLNGEATMPGADNNTAQNYMLLHIYVQFTNLHLTMLRPAPYHAQGRRHCGVTISLSNTFSCWYGGSACAS